MRFIFILSIYIACILTLNACNQNSDEPIQIQNAWIREAPPGASAMAGYMTITNTSDDDLILHQADSESFKAIEFHRSIEKDGVYKMVPHIHLHIAAHSTIELKPGDYHLMMFKPDQTFKENDTIKINLKFSNEHNVQAHIPVKKAEY